MAGSTASNIRKAIRISVSLMFSESVAFMIPPLVALALVQAGRSVMEAGSAAAAPAVGVLLGVPLIPDIVRRLGQRQTFRLGGMLLVLALIGYCFADGGMSMALWWALGLLAGFAQAARWIVADAAVSSIASDEDRGRIMSIHETLRSMAIGFGPGLVVLAEAEIRIAALLATVFAVCGLLTSSAVPHTDAIGGASRQMRWNALPLTAAILAFSGGSLEAATSASVPVYGLGLGMTAAAAAALASGAGFGNLATQYPIGLAMDRVGSRRVAIIVCAGCALLALLLPSAISGGIGLALVFLFGGLTGAFYTLGIVEGTAANGDTNSVVAVIALAYTLGSFAGPVLGSLAIMAQSALGLPLTLAAGCLATMAPLLWRSVRAA